MESAMQLGLVQDEQLDAVTGGCGGYKYRPSREDHEQRCSGSRRGNVVAVSDINITVDDGSQVFVTFVQDTEGKNGKAHVRDFTRRVPVAG